MKFILPAFIEPTIDQWRPIDKGRLGGALANLEDDEWRLERRLDWSFSPEDKTEFDLSENDVVWAVSHVGVIVAFVESEDTATVIYVNRLSRGSMGWV